ncbi:hypothetical protein DSAG12_02974 [Promethearchaeum syntrophicum]|uniref:Uncharacterized protein n=1 Tax=Promethearchaeum syntrophicum TaxID=2594042 RepID=A0A5B9DDE2_9ARCH|nr:hypothetical protein [Candidatus Prometheoarchaeum syntrophicum]QEE17142.1 hypothetical protein DSAG12_02974 [Candidatus Prometheoarchaeum syntrophicum]
MTAKYSRSWNTKEWKDQRKKLIQDQFCQQCGKKHDLQIHHHYTERSLRNIMERRVVKQLIESKMRSGEIPFQGKKERFFHCPLCDNQQIVSNNKYKNVTCKKCQKFQKLDESNTKIEVKYNFNLGKRGIRIFIWKYRDEINTILEEKHAPPIPNYMNLAQDTIILCKVCHYALENGHDLCPICKKNYKKIQNSMCFDCLPPEEKNRIAQNS